MRIRRLRQRDKQSGRAILQLLGDRGEIIFPDRGARSLRTYIKKYQNRHSDGHGSHMNGKHKLG